MPFSSIISCSKCVSSFCDTLSSDSLRPTFASDVGTILLYSVHMFLLVAFLNWWPFAFLLNRSANTFLLPSIYVQWWIRIETSGLPTCVVLQVHIIMHLDGVLKARTNRIHLYVLYKSFWVWTAEDIVHSIEYFHYCECFLFIICPAPLRPGKLSPRNPNASCSDSTIFLSAFCILDWVITPA